jgi:hypothetical protein
MKGDLEREAQSDMGRLRATIRMLDSLPGRDYVSCPTCHASCDHHGAPPAKRFYPYTSWNACCGD